MSPIEQQPESPPQVVLGQSEQGMQLQALLSHQATTVGRIVGSEGELRGMRAQYEGLTGSDRTYGEREMQNLEGRIRGMKADLDETRAKIRELRNSSDVQQPQTVGVTVVEDQSRVLGLRPNDFVGGLVILFVFPIVVAISRWIWRRAPARDRGNLTVGSPQFARLEQAVEAIAIEVERIGEAQRFSAKLLAERPVEAEGAQPPRTARSRRPIITPVP